MKRVLVRSILAASLAATLFTGTALGHECFVASRSDVGDLKAGSQSKAWLTVGTTADVFGFVGDFLGLPALTAEQLAWAVEAGKAAGLPNQFTLFIANHTIAEGTPAMDMHGADGRGIDHAFDWFPVIAGIYGEALAQ